MPMINRAGTFNALPLSIGVVEEGSNKLACAVIQFRLYEEAINGEWKDILAECVEIIGWFYLEKLDKSVNARTVDSLRAAFGWSGTDAYWLEDTDLSSVPVQLVLDFEHYQGKDRLKVKWLNPHGAQGGGYEVKRADAATRRAIQTRLGSKLRALSGGVPANLPKPAGPPKPPASAKPTPPPPARPAVPAGCTRDEAWQTLYDARPDDANGWWPAILAEVAPNKSEADFTPEDWAKVRERAKTAEGIPY